MTLLLEATLLRSRHVCRTQPLHEEALRHPAKRSHASICTNAQKAPHAILCSLNTHTALFRSYAAVEQLLELADVCCLSCCKQRARAVIASIVSHRCHYRRHLYGTWKRINAAYLFTSVCVAVIAWRLRKYAARHVACIHNVAGAI